ncbi:MAG TPA: GvpL/GvpF family gas vesicle protein [Thermoanaerobaculia bacterium]|nr:GvpL/GvpF family gas vesicle protein [Thermoanaerobaculia bacterium]
MILYVYAIGRARHPLPDDVEAVDGGGLTAFVSPVDEVEFSQPVIDARAKDVEWLGRIGYRHQSVMIELMRGGTIIPLRAFTLFKTHASLKHHLEENREQFEKILERIDGKQEWTLQIEFDPERWRDALSKRVASLGALENDVENAAPGKAFLLRKKLDEERKQASREAEQQVSSEIEQAVLEALKSEVVAESRERRDGAFPQINVLLPRDEEARLQELHDSLARRYTDEGVTLALTGPWPPYTFAR